MSQHISSLWPVQSHAPAFPTYEILAAATSNGRIQKAAERPLFLAITLSLRDKRSLIRSIQLTNSSSRSRLTYLHPQRKHP